MNETQKQELHDLLVEASDRINASEGQYSLDDVEEIANDIHDFFAGNAIGSSAVIDSYEPYDKAMGVMEVRDSASNIETAWDNFMLISGLQTFCTGVCRYMAFIEREEAKKED